VIEKPRGRQITCYTEECQKKAEQLARRRSRAMERARWKEKPRRKPANQPGYTPPTYEVVTSFRSRELLAVDGDRRVARWAMEDGARMPDLKNSDEVEL
jgi:hypothetical protein